MSQVMSLQHWMKMTDGGTFSTRSSSLKKVDAALGKYDKSKSKPDLDALRTALLAWMGEKGSDWKSSIRNKFHAVDDLHRQVMGLPELKKTGEQMVALSELQMEEAALLDKLFLNKTLDFRPGIWSKILGGKEVTRTQKTLFKNDVRSVASNVKTLAGTNPSAKSGAHAAESIFTTMLAPVAADLREEVKSLVLVAMPGFMAELAASATPYLGLIVTGTSTVASYASLAATQYRLDQSEMHARRMLIMGNPEKAVTAITLMFERERTSLAVTAAINSAAFGGKAAGLFLDLGTATNAAVGLAASIAKLANAVRIIWRDVAQRKEANQLMKLPVKPEIFSASPILGAYYICCAPTSVLVNSVFPRWWQHGVKGEIERNVVRHVGPMRESARKLIHADRFYIQALQRYPGVLAVNEKALEAMEKAKDPLRTDFMSSATV